MSGRFDYVQYDQKAQSLQSALKDQMMQLEGLVNHLGDGREKSLVYTKLEEAYMWMGKQIRDDQIKRNGSAELQEQRGNSQFDRGGMWRR